MSRMFSQNLDKCWYKTLRNLWLIVRKVLKNERFLTSRNIVVVKGLENLKCYGLQSRSYCFKSFKGCLSQILFGPFLNIFPICDVFEVISEKTLWSKNFNWTLKTFLCEVIRNYNSYKVIHKLFYISLFCISKNH